MNTIDNKFSSRRLWAVMKRDFAENRTRYIGWFFLMFVAFLGYQLFEIRDLIAMCQYHAIHPVTPETYGFNPEHCMAILARKSNALFYYILVLAFAYTATEICSSSIRTKMQATNYLMMPALSLEKFLSRVFINTVLTFALAYAALLCADLVRILLVLLFEVKDFHGFTAPFLCETSYFINPFAGFGPFGFGVCKVNVDNYLSRTGFTPCVGAMTIILYLLFILAIHSFFVLGGSIWRKGGFIKTLLVGIVTIETIVWGYYKVENYLYLHYRGSIGTIEATLQIALFIATLLCMALTIVNWRVSYRFFTQQQVVMPTSKFAQWLKIRKEVA